MSDARGPAGPPCPICRKPAKSRAENASFPFCSTRCKQVDLGKWLNEEYRVPAEDANDDVDGADDAAPSGPDPSKLH